MVRLYARMSVCVPAAVVSATSAGVVIAAVVATVVAVESKDANADYDKRTTELSATIY